MLSEARGSSSPQAHGRGSQRFEPDRYGYGHHWHDGGSLDQADIKSRAGRSAEPRSASSPPWPERPLLDASASAWRRGRAGLRARFESESSWPYRRFSWSVQPSTRSCGYVYLYLSHLVCCQGRDGAHPPLGGGWETAEAASCPGARGPSAETLLQTLLYWLGCSYVLFRYPAQTCPKACAALPHAASSPQ